jgi:hypothetical protein
MRPDRITMYIALGVIASCIAAITGPSPALLTLAQIVLVVECVNLIHAPGDDIPGGAGTLSESEGE